MGKRGFYILHGLHNQEPLVIAKQFCTKNYFGPKTTLLVAELVQEKIEQFKEYNKHEYKVQQKVEWIGLIEIE